MSKRFAKCLKIFAMAMLAGMALAGLVPGQIYARDTIDLELGGAGAIPWNISDITPGDSGTETVTLHNAGDRQGSVNIWFSDIVACDPAGDGATLENYLLFDVSCLRATTNIALPARIADLPHSAVDPNYLKIYGLDAGETVTLVWEWEFRENGLPQNDAQGDSLSFTISYFLNDSLSSGDAYGGLSAASWTLNPEPEPEPEPLPTTTEPGPTPPSAPAAGQMLSPPQNPGIPLTTTPPEFQPGPSIPLPAPAEFDLTDLVISPASVHRDEPVTLSVSVQNNGNLEGKYTLRLEINGEIEQSREIILGGGESTQVIFTIVRDEPGNYVVTLNSLSGEFTVLAPEVPAFHSNTFLLAVAAAVPSAGLLIYLFAIKFKVIV